MPGTVRPNLLLVVLLSLSIFVGLTGTAVGVYGLAIAGDASDKADAIVQARSTSRKIACDAENEQQLRSRAGDDRQTRVMFDALNNFTRGDRTAEEDAQVQAFLDRLYADQAKAAEESYPLRDCSPEAIKAFYEGKP